MTRLKAKQAAVIHLRAANNLAWVHACIGIKGIFHLLKRTRDLLTELPLHPLAAHQTVTVLARKRAFVFAHQRARLFCNHAHFLCAVVPHIQNRAHMQRAHRCMCIPGALSAVLGKNLCQLGGVLGQMLQWYGAVFNKRHGFAVTTQRHHDV